MPVVHRIRTNEDIVNGLVTTRPGDDGTRHDYAGGAQTIGSGTNESNHTHWGTLAGRYLTGPSGWNQ